MSDAEVERPTAVMVAFRVYAACLGWGMLTGAVLGALYLTLSIAQDGGGPGAGEAAVVGASYGASIGLLAGVVLGVGAAVGAGIGAVRDREAASGIPVDATGVDEGSRTRTTLTVRLARAGFLAVAVVVLLAWRFLFGDEPDRWFQWRIVTALAAALLFGAWRSGRSARFAVVRRSSVVH